MSKKMKQNSLSSNPMLTKFLSEQKKKRISNQKRNSIIVTGSKDQLRQSLELDSEGFTRTASDNRIITTPSQNGEHNKGADKKNLSKMKTQSEIKEMIASAKQTSMELKLVDPRILSELRDLNLKFLTQDQCD